MARARNIKPAIMDNEELAELPFEARLLFIYLWMLADREGRLEDRPKRIAAQALPYDRSVDVDATLNTLAEAGFIERYQVGSERFIQVTNFVKHQTPHGTERDGVIPDKNGATTVYERTTKGYATKAQQVPNSDLTVKEQRDNALIPDSLIPDSSAPDGADDEPKQPPAKPAKQAFAAPEWVPADEWRDFVQMRKAMRNVPFTDAAARGVVAELDKLRQQGHAPHELLRLAVTNGWRTVYPPKPGQSNGARASPPQSRHTAAARAIYGAPTFPETIDVEATVRQH